MSKSQNGYATVLVLSFAVLISAILLAYSLWVRWEAYSTLNFLNRGQAHSQALRGIDIGLNLLLDDSDPLVDTLQEDWARGFADQQVKVEIIDIGSNIGVNWMDLDWWNQLIPENPVQAEEIHKFIMNQEALIGSMEELARVDYSEILDKQKLLTVYSSFNINSLGEEAMMKLWKATGYGDLSARNITKEILDKQKEGLLALDDLLSITSMTQGAFDKAFPWLSLTGPININTASLDVLQIAFQVAGFQRDYSEEIVSSRERFPISSAGDLTNLIDLEEKELAILLNWLGFHSTYFKIISAPQTSDFQIAVIVRRTWLGESGEWELEMLQWIERDKVVQEMEKSDLHSDTRY